MPSLARPCYPVDFTPLMTMRDGRDVKEVAILVAPSKKAKKHTGWIAIRRPKGDEVIVHGELDDHGIGPFFHEALARVRARWPAAQIHSMMRIGTWATGIPCPPPPPPWTALVKGIDQVLAATPAPGVPRGNGGRTAVRAKIAPPR